MTDANATIGVPVEAALAYARAGWPVFPCHWTTDTGCSCGRADCDGPGKHPLLRHGFKDASTDPTVIDGWWTRWPQANVAIATGHPAPDVVDIDVKDGAPGPANCRRLSEAGLLRGARAVVTTPSGGWHLYYEGTEQGNGSLHKHGIDFRSRGGYVLVPPSVVDGRPYTLALHRKSTGVTVDFAAIRAFLDPPRQIRPGVSWSSRGDFDALIRHVAGQQKGNRNKALHWAACRAVDSGADEDVFDALIAAAVSTGHTLGGARATVASARRTAVAA